jgi:hypothetical protein
MLEAPCQLNEGLHVAAAGLVHECFQIHRHVLTIRCQETGIAFKAAIKLFDAGSCGRLRP